MADEFDGAQKPESGGAADPFAAQIAMAASGAAAEEEAREYLKRQSIVAEKQSRLLDLQIENMRDVDKYEISHLRWRRLNDQLRGAMQLMLVAIGALIVVAIAAALWSASQANGIVVDEFSVPSQFAQNGIGGDVVAGDMTNKLHAIGNIANGNSLDTSAQVRNDRNSITVEIPDTGVSLAEAWRYLRLWLGHERHMSGSLRLAGGNRIALTVALDGAPAIVLEGPLADLDKLEQQAAERVFAAVDPINDVLYLEVSGRPDDAMAQAARAPQQVAAPIYRAVAYSLWAFETRRLTGNLALARQRIALAIATDPKVAPAHIEIVREASVLGHDEEELQAARSLAHFRRQDQPLSMRGRGFDEIEYEAGSARDTETGDFQAAAGLVCGDLHPAAMVLCALYAARSRDAARGRVLLVRAQAGGESDAAAIALARYYVDADIGAWLAAVVDARQYLSVEKTQPRQSAKLSDLEARTRTLPLLAVATAETGDMAGAKALIAKAPSDCDACVRAHGRIAAIAHDWTAAAHWFAVVSARSPDIPFADSDWGQMLLRKGDFNGAIAKFASANRKGAHFADPLEYWGEALIAKNRSDLALAKFAEANKYAPNWGRLHLKWGEALLWIGDKAGAAKQFAVAAHLDLTPSEKSELVRVSHG